MPNARIIKYMAIIMSMIENGSFMRIRPLIMRYIIVGTMAAIKKPKCTPIRIVATAKSNTFSIHNASIA